MSRFIALLVLLAVGLESQAKPSPNLALALFRNGNEFFGQSATDTINEVRENINAVSEMRRAVRENVISIMSQIFNPFDAIPTGGISTGVNAISNAAALANANTAGLDAVFSLGGLAGRSAGVNANVAVTADGNAAEENTASDGAVAAEEDTASDAPAEADGNAAEEDAATENSDVAEESGNNPVSNLIPSFF